MHAPCLRQNLGPGQSTQVSVECDVEVFAWLLRHVKAGREANPAAAAAAPPLLAPPHLELHLCVPILPVASFLQMRGVVQHCSAYIAANLVPLMDWCQQLCAMERPLLAGIAQVGGCWHCQQYCWSDGQKYTIIHNTTRHARPHVLPSAWSVPLH